MEEWRKSPQNPRNTPKLSLDEAQTITDEAIAGGRVWKPQEEINARRLKELKAQCGGVLGKIQAPTKLDAWNPARCQLGEGAFGTYFVHPSNRYGVKVFRDPDTDVDWEFDRLGKARAAGVNCPEPLSMNAVTDEYGDVRAHTMVLSHMNGYDQAARTNLNRYGYDLAQAPLIVRVKAAREFRKLHVEGLAHGDIHTGNILINPRSKKVAIVDFGFSTQIDDYYHPMHGRTGVENLMSDLRVLPDFLGIQGRDNRDFFDMYSGVLDNIELQANDYSRSWEKYELGVKRYHDVLENWILDDKKKPRSRLIQSITQPRIPGLDRRIVTALFNTNERQQVALWLATGQGNLPSFARGRGLNIKQLFQALKPERQALRRGP